MAADVTKGLSFIAPERLYTLKGFMAASGVSETRRREAQPAGHNITNARGRPSQICARH